MVATLKPQWLQGSLHPAPSLQLGASQGKRPGYADAARLAAPAVVSISASKPGQPLSEEEEAWLRYHGGSPDDDERDGPRGTGSGVIVSPEGYVLTNNHVVENATEILIQLSDGRVLDYDYLVIATGPKLAYSEQMAHELRIPLVRLIDASGGKAQIRTLGGETLVATRSGDRIQFADTSGTIASVTGGDDERSNGIIHHIDAVLMPGK